MEAKYADWVEGYVSSVPNRYVRGKCSEATKKMVEAFPELRRAAGFVVVPWGEGEEQHWWCVAPDGSVVDPTREQFPWVGGYEEVDPANPHRPIPTGKCMECGGSAYGGETFCGKDCETAFCASM